MELCGEYMLCIIAIQNTNLIVIAMHAIMFTPIHVYTLYTDHTYCSAHVYVIS